MSYRIDHQIFLDQISDLLFSLDVVGNVLYMNKSIEKILGYEPNTIIGHSISKILTDESWQRVQRLFQSHIRFKREVTVPLPFIKADGEIAILESKAVPIAQGNKVVSIEGICRDITEKVRLEKQLKEEKWQAQILYEIAAILNRPIEPEDTVELCLVKLCELLAVPIGYIRSFNFASRTAPLIAARGLSASYLNEEKTSSIKLYDSPFYTYLSQGNHLVIDNFEQDTKLPRKKLLREGVRSAVYIPIKTSKGTLVGLLALASRDYNYFKPEILPCLEGITSQMGIAAERTLYQQRLARTKEKYQHIFTHANDLIYIIDLEENLIEANLAAREFTGYDLGGKVQIGTLIAPDKPDELIKFRRILQQLIKEEITKASFEIEVVKKNGDRAILESRGVLIKDHTGKLIGFQGISRDITERKRLEKEIRDAKEFLSNIMQQMLDIIIVADPQGIVTFFNPGAKSISGYEAEEILGQPVWKFYAKGKKEAQNIASLLIKNGRVANYELDLVEKGGHIIPLLASFVLLKNEKGESAGTMGVAKDLSEKKILERAVFQSEKLASIGQLAAGAAHEIFNPMQIILGITQLLIQKQEINDIRITQLKKIEDQVKRVTDVINGLRQFSLVSSQEKALLDINTTLKEALSLIAYDFPQDGIELVAKLNPQPLMVLGDKMELIQLFVNLLINARDAMLKGGRVRVSTARHINRGKGWSRIIISDTGSGISPERLPKIFDPFFTTKEVGKGTGLGLSVCHGIVRRHDGLISVESEPEQGTTFTIDLPLTPKNSE